MAGVAWSSATKSMYQLAGTRLRLSGTVTWIPVPSLVFFRARAMERCSTPVTWVVELGWISRAVLITDAYLVKVAFAPSLTVLGPLVSDGRASR